MKNKIYILTALLSFTAAVSRAQSVPQSFNFSGNMTVRGIPFSFTCNSTYYLSIEIRNLTPTGTLLYRESHTNAVITNGFFNLRVGTGTVTSGTFSAITSPGDKYCSVVFYSPDPFNPVISTTPQLISSVPNALVSERSLQWNNSGTDMSSANAGKVGIGTNTPAEKLDVNGAVKLGSTTNANDGTIRYTGTDFEGRVGGSWLSLTAQGGGGGSFWTNAQGGINYTGNVGIGSMSATISSKLRVEGGRVDFINLNEQDLYGVQTTFGNFLNVTIPQQFQAYTQSGNATYAVNRPALYGYSHNNVGVIGASSASAGGLFVSASGPALIAMGNTGIGTISPLEMLDVAGGARIGFTNGTNPGTMRYNNQTAKFEGYAGGNSPGWKSLMSADAGWLTNGTVVYPNPTTPRVSIGTTVSQSPLTVHSAPGVLESQATISATMATSARLAFTNDSTTNNQFRISTRFSSLLGSTKLSFETPVINGNILTLVDTGTIGIGTTTPRAKTEIFANSSSNFPQLKLFENQNDFARLQFQNSNPNADSWTLAANTNSDPLQSVFNLNNSVAGNVISVNATGKVGIGGNATPVGKVEIDYDSGTEPHLNLYEMADDYARIQFNNSGAGTKWTVAGYGGANSGLARFHINNNIGGNILSVAGNGKVGIKEPNPAVALDVNGALGVSKTSESITIPLGGTYVITVSDRSFIEFAFNSNWSATPPVTYIELTDGVKAGQILILKRHCYTAGDGEMPLRLIDGVFSLGTALNGNWNPDLCDSITLIWDGLAWVELSRSSN
ncbi:MAG: hypothetical protein IPH78_06140 [Bacteroidetes bacterium]|nr:hypothetical protein [Bacteroidota bacterium]MBK8657430.1 hypothetical protein [Bacteroidota bacterium]